MTSIPEPFAIINGQRADGDQLEADLAIIRTICNGQLELGVNVQAGSTGSALTGNSSVGGSSGFGSRADHQHIIRGVERLTSDPTSGNDVGRMYYDTTNNRLRMCINAAGAGTWVTGPNLAASDLPIHSSRHATGGADPLPSNAVGETMFAARTIFEGVPSADVVTTANGWNDVVTGLAVTVTNTQVAWLVVNIGIVNLNGSNSPVVTSRVLDASNNVLFQSSGHQMSTQGANNDQQSINAVMPVALSASPTLRLQVNANLAGVTVRKSQTSNGSTFAVTKLQAVVG